MKKSCIAISFALFTAHAAAAQTVVAFWDQNSNNLPTGGFGFQVGDFPQFASHGLQSGSAFIQPSAGMLANFDPNTNVYTDVVSFAGTTANALSGVGSGGSLSIRGGAGDGEWFDVVVDATMLRDLQISWAQRGTSTGFSSRTVAVSTDGQSFTEIYSDSGTLGGWTVKSADAGALLDGASNAIFRFTLDGATAAGGNNRFDNILIEAVVIPLPGAAGMAFAGIGLCALRRRR